MLLEVCNIRKTYPIEKNKTPLTVLEQVDFSVKEGEYVAIMGESGSGKTTLLNIIAGFDPPTSGTIRLDGKDLFTIKQAALSAFRREHLGFVFQEFNLLNSFSAKDNIVLPLVLSDYPKEEMETRLIPIASQLGITEILDKYPSQLSGGQKQRVAVARALITSPKLILADEPTGALDLHATTQLLDLFDEINKKGQTILLVTHSVAAASHCQRVLF
ncbi:MAG: ABC transporter ATP-binding protein, partial [Anaerovoracaceae bacterium]